MRIPVCRSLQNMSLGPSISGQEGTKSPLIAESYIPTIVKERFDLDRVLDRSGRWVFDVCQNATGREVLGRKPEECHNPSFIETRW
jgi:hypothetical protein